MRGGGVRRLMAKVMKNFRFFVWNTSLIWAKVSDVYLQSIALSTTSSNFANLIVNVIIFMNFPSVYTTTWWSRIKDTATTTDTDTNTTTQRIMIVSWWNFAAFPLLVPFRQRRTSYAFNSLLTKGERELPFPSVPGNESLLIPVPEIWECFFFHSLFYPECWECFFHSPLVPELWE